jgi:hypothetical protein
MGMPNWLWLVAAFLLVYFVLVPFAGLGNAGYLSIIFTVGFIFLLEAFGIRLLPWKLKKTWIYAIAILCIGYVAITAGWLAKLGIPGFMVPGAVTPTAPAVSGLSCAESISPEIRGTTATLDVNAWDLESDTPYSTAVDANPTYVYKNGNSGGDYVTSITDTSGATVSGYSVGDIAYLYPTGTTYYGEALEGVCVDTQRKSVSLNVHKIATETDMQITGYDDTGTTTLTSGTSGQEDYEISMGASEKKTFYIKLKMNAANEAFNLGGIAVRLLNDAKALRLIESGFDKVATPTFLDNVNIAINDSPSYSVNITGGYDFVWKKTTPQLLKEWDSVKYQFEVESSTTDPTADDTVSPTSADLVILQFVDAQWARGEDGRVYLDFYQHDANEGNVGMSETVTSPLGKTTGTIIELT